MKRSRIRSTPKYRCNRASKAAKQERDRERTEGPPGFREWVKAQRCVIQHECRGPVLFCHWRTRAAGGTWREVLPWCAGAEEEFHRVGRETFAARHGLDYRAESDALLERWEASQ